jgi:5'-methylthioadenosine phosphorylase
MKPLAEIGVFGGSGFYSFLDKVEEVKVDTPYGAPSDTVSIGEVNGRRVAFLPRHGRKHTIPSAQNQLPREPLGDEGTRRAGGD